jgi:hypothetical protein
MRTVTIEKSGDNYTVNPNATSNTTWYVYKLANLADDYVPDGSVLLPTNQISEITVGMTGYLCSSSSECLVKGQVIEVSGNTFQVEAHHGSFTFRVNIDLDSDPVTELTL